MVTYEEEVIQSNIQSYSYLIFIDLAADLDSKHADYSLDQVQTVQSAEHISGVQSTPEYHMLSLDNYTLITGGSV